MTFFIARALVSITLTYFALAKSTIGTRLDMSCWCVLGFSKFNDNFGEQYVAKNAFKNSSHIFQNNQIISENLCIYHADEQKILEDDFSLNNQIVDNMKFYPSNLNLSPKTHTQISKKKKKKKFVFWNMNIIIVKVLKKTFKPKT